MNIFSVTLSVHKVRLDIRYPTGHKKVGISVARTNTCFIYDLFIYRRALHRPVIFPPLTPHIYRLVRTVFPKKTFICSFREKNMIIFVKYRPVMLAANSPQHNYRNYSLCFPFQGSLVQFA